MINGMNEVSGFSRDSYLNKVIFFYVYGCMQFFGFISLVLFFFLGMDRWVDG